MNQPVFPFLCRLKIYPAAPLLRWVVAVKNTEFFTAAQQALVQASQLRHAAEFVRFFIPDEFRVPSLKFDGFQLFRVIASPKEDFLPRPLSDQDRKSTRLNSSHASKSRMPSSA